MALNIKHDDKAQRTPDRVGGRGTWDTAVYECTIDMAYSDQSKGGASGVFLTLLGPDGQRMRQTVWVTNKKGENFYVSDGEKNLLPGFQLMDDLFKIVAGKTVLEATEEKRTINIYDRMQRKEVPTEKDVMTDIVGRKVHTAVWRVIDNKRVKNPDGTYGPGPDKVEYNEVAGFFHPDGTTVVEKDAGTEPDFLPKWRKQWEGKPLYRYKDVGAAAPAANAGQAAGSQPKAPSANPFA